MKKPIQLTIWGSNLIFGQLIKLRGKAEKLVIANSECWPRSNILNTCQHNNPTGIVAFYRGKWVH